jgi:hypothetical protein
MVGQIGLPSSFANVHQQAELRFLPTAKRFAGPPKASVKFDNSPLPQVSVPSFWLPL